MSVTVNTHESGQSLEPVLSCPEGATPASASGHYAAVRYNALQHGILSRLAALVEEHRPAGITEHTLIEALATAHLAQAASSAGRGRGSIKG